MGGGSTLGSIASLPSDPFSECDADGRQRIHALKVGSYRTGIAVGSRGGRMTESRQSKGRGQLG
jgi:hypothetical protein